MERGGGMGEPDTMMLQFGPRMTRVLGCLRGGVSGLST